LARLIVDGVDPQSVAQRMKGRSVMIQMALLDIIIPNRTTELLAKIGDIPKRDYLGEHGFLAIPVEPAYLRGNSEMAGFLDGRFTP